MTDPQAVRAALVDVQAKLDAAEGERATLVQRRREFIADALALDPPMTQTAIAELLGVSGPIVNRLCKRAS